MLAQQCRGWGTGQAMQCRPCPADPQGARASQGPSTSVATTATVTTPSLSQPASPAEQLDRGGSAADPSGSSQQGAAPAAAEDAATATQPAQQATLDDGIPVFERAAAALVFLLPFSEGMYRLMLIAAAHCRRNALDLMVWSQVQQAALTSILEDKGGLAVQHLQDELQAAKMLSEWAQLVYARLDHAATQLAALSQQPLVPLQLPQLQLPPGLLPPGVSGADVSSWAAATFAAPAALWTLACLAGTAWLIATAARQAGVPVGWTGIAAAAAAKVGGGGAGAATTSSSQGSDARSGASAPAGDAPSPAWFKRPEVPLLAAICALLLRVSWVPAESLSGAAGAAVALGIYKPAAFLLTTASTFIALAAALKLLASNWQQPKAACRELLAAVQGVVLWHRALLFLDWVVSLFSPLPLAAKGQLMIAFGVYGMTCEWLSRRAEAVSARLK